PLQQALNMYCIPRLAENTTVEISSLGHEAGLMGAAALVMENFERTNTKLSKSQLAPKDLIHASF
ncbi:MAG: hypothetical protein QM629_11865, partial [Parafilimonas sp.]